MTQDFYQTTEVESNEKYIPVYDFNIKYRFNPAESNHRLFICKSFLRATLFKVATDSIKNINNGTTTKQIFESLIEELYKQKIEASLFTKDEVSNAMQWAKRLGLVKPVRKGSKNWVINLTNILRAGD